MSPHHQYIVWSALSVRRARTRRRMLSTRVLTTLGKLQHMSKGQHAAILAQWKGGHPCLGPRPPFGPQWGHVWAPSWPVCDLHILLSQQSSRVTCCVGSGIALEIEFRPKPSFRVAYYPGEARCSVGGCGFKSTQPVHSSPPWWIASYHDCGATVTARGLGACIYQSHPLPAAHAITTIIVKQCEARLITEDTVLPMPEVSPSVRSPAHTVASPGIQSQSGTSVGTP